jgi:hypothetical protein
MARNENPPFPRGATYFGGDSTIVETVVSANLEGQEYEFEDEDFTNGTIGSCPLRSNRRVRCRVVRNSSGGTLAPKLLVALNASASSAMGVAGQVSGLAGAQAKGYPVDEWLTSAVISNDLFYVVVDGYAKVTTAGSGSTTIAVGGVVVGAASGLCVAQDTTTTGANLFAQIQNAVGKAVTAVAAASTDFVVDVNGTHR